MFRPARMSKVELQVPQHLVAKTTCMIANLKRLHLINIRKTRIGKTDLESPADRILQRKYAEMKGRLAKILTFLQIDPDDLSYCLCQKEVNPPEDVFQIEREVQQLEEEISCLIHEVEIPENIKQEKEDLLELLEIVSITGVDINQFSQCRFLYLSVGLVPTDNLERLELSLSNTYHLLVPSASSGKRRLIFVFGSRKDQEKIEKALKSAYFEKMSIPYQDKFHGDNIRSLQNQIQKFEKQSSSAQVQLERMKGQINKRLAKINRKVLCALNILEIGKSFDQVGNTCHISAWAPQQVVPALKKEVKKVMEAVDHQVKITITPFSLARQEKAELSKIPTCFQNPVFLKPFEKLISEYGIPCYGEVEPTFFFALTFLLMFGVMFGDVGHGLTLFLAGLLTFKKFAKENIQDIGLIIMECGLMSTLFGFFYGSVFGFEHILPALWFNPMENIHYFMKVTMGFGVAIISLGVILNIINSIKNNDYKEGVFGEFGVMGLTFYWGCIGLVVLYMATGEFLTGHTYMFLFFPLVIIFLKEPLFNLYNRLVNKKEQPIFPENMGIYFMESFIEVGDTIIGFLSNTVSFIRVAAFALAHAGLFLAVFAMADSIMNLKGGIFWYWIIIIVGNIAIIVIEGVIVSIQTIRLEYYEFFSKFFKGGGQIYKPLHI